MRLPTLTEIANHLDDCEEEIKELRERLANIIADDWFLPEEKAEAFLYEAGPFQVDTELTDNSVLRSGFVSIKDSSVCEEEEEAESVFEMQHPIRNEVLCDMVMLARPQYAKAIESHYIAI